MSTLTIQQQDRLDDLELVITEHESGFLKVAEALGAIWEEELWKPKYESFEAYCKSRWGWSSKHAKRMIRSAESVTRVAAEFAPIGAGNSDYQALTSKIALIPESAARELAKVKRGKQKEVFQDASSNGTVVPTAAAIKESAKPKPSDPAEPEVVRDGTGYPVPEKRLLMWKRRSEAQKILSLVSDLRGIVRRLEDAKKSGGHDPLYESTDLQGALLKLDSVYVTLEEALPCAVCADCQGQRSETCLSCKGRAFVSKNFWFNCLCEEARQLRSMSVQQCK